MAVRIGVVDPAGGPRPRPGDTRRDDFAERQVDVAGEPPAVEAAKARQHLSAGAAKHRPSRYEIDSTRERALAGSDRSRSLDDFYSLERPTVPVTDAGVCVRHAYAIV